MSTSDQNSNANVYAGLVYLTGFSLAVPEGHISCYKICFKKSCFKSFSPLWMSQVSYWVQSSTRNLHLVNWIVILIPTEHLGSLYIKDRHLSLVFVIVPHSTTQWNGLKLQNTVSTSTIVNFEFFVEMIESFFPHFWHSQLFLGSLCALVLHTSFFIHIHVWLM